MIELIGWMVGGILGLNLARLFLALNINDKTNEANKMLDTQRLRWNQMCEDVTEWVMGMEKKEEGRSAFCSHPEIPCQLHEAMQHCPDGCPYFIDADPPDFNLRKQFYEQSKDFIQNAEDGSEPYDPHN